MHAKSLSQEDCTWLKSLTTEEGQISTGPKLTIEEEQRMVRLAQEHGLPCTLEAWGYGFGLVIHNHPERNGDLPKPLANISGYLKLDWPGSEEILARRIATALTHTQDNIELLRFYGFEPLNPDPTHYCY